MLVTKLGNIMSDENSEGISKKTLGSMTPQQYIEERVKSYRKWYSKKARMYKKRYLILQTLSVVGAAVVPVLVNLSIPFKEFITTAISLMVVILVSMESVLHYREQWLNYRSTEQYLGKELYLFLTQEGPYVDMSEKQAFIVFVERVEKAIEAENKATLSIMTLAPPQKDEKNGK